MSKQLRSCVINLSDTLARLPGPAGEHAVSVLQRATLHAKLSAPKVPVRQTPHEQDEIYVIIRGRGILFHDGRRDPFERGDLLFVAAGTEHQFEDCTEDLAVWVVFYGARGGEVPILSRKRHKRNSSEFSL